MARVKIAQDAWHPIAPSKLPGRPGIKPRGVPALLRHYEAILTPSQMAVFLDLLRGRTIEEIAARTHRDVLTIRGHVRRLYKQLDVHSQIGLLARVYRPVLRRLSRLT